MPIVTKRGRAERNILLALYAVAPEIVPQRELPDGYGRRGRGATGSWLSALREQGLIEWCERNAPPGRSYAKTYGYRITARGIEEVAQQGWTR